MARLNGPPSVCFVGKHLLSPPIEGHCVASKRLIEASIRAGTDTSSEVVTIESNIGNLENPWNWVTVKSKISSQVHIWFSASVISAVDDLLSSISIASHIKSSKFDLVHVLNLNKEAYLLIHSLLRAKKTLLMHFYHSPLVLNDDVFFIRNIAFRAGLYGRVFNNHALTVNHSLLEFLVEKIGVDPERVHYAPYPIDVETFKPSKDRDNLREKYGFPLDCPIVTYVGSLSPTRGILHFIKSFHYVVARFPEALLYISHPNRKGEDVYVRYIYGLMHDLKLQDNLIIQGPNSHVEEDFNLADVVVLPFIRPYWVDPPLVLLEAMSTGASVITTSTGSIGEIIENHKNGILTKPKNPSILANAIIELLENPRESREIGEEARKTIVQNYSYEIVGARLSKIYGLILNNVS